MNRLGPDVRLERGETQPVLRYLPRAGRPPLPPPPPLPLHPLTAAILACLDAGWEVGELADHLAARLRNPRPVIEETVGDAVACFRAHFRHTGPGDFVDLGDVEEILDRLADGTVYRTRDVVLAGDRSPFPLTLQWMVTHNCNRRCIYCYQGAIASAKAQDSLLSTEEVCAIVSEAAQLGTQTFFLTGGEPLLREDIYDILVHALEEGLRPYLLTKQHIPEEAVARLARAGLREIVLSIDSFDPRTAARMTGTRTFARDLHRTAERLIAHGVRVSTKTVLTTENLEALPATLAELRRLGVHRAEIDTYAPNLQRHDDRLLPSDPQIECVAGWVRDAHDPAGGFAVAFDGGSKRPAARDGLGEDCIVCHNGLTTLLFMPDGRVSRCDKPLPAEMMVGDLRRQTVREVWSSAAMLDSLKPPRELYRGTLCEDCADFGVCHQRGRCFYDAHLTSGTMWGPQSNCPYLDPATVACNAC